MFAALNKKFRQLVGLLSVGPVLVPSAAVHVASSRATEITLIAQAALNQTANIQEWRSSTGAVLVSVRNVSGVGYASLGRYEFSAEPATRYIDSGLWTSNLAIELRAPLVRISGNSGSGESHLSVATATVSGLTSTWLYTGLGVHLLIQPKDSDGIVDRLPGSLHLRGAAVHVNNTTNVTGGSVVIAGGSGAADPAGIGGDVTLDGGVTGGGGKGNIIMGTLPTASAGLPAGALWNDSGTLKIA